MRLSARWENAALAAASLAAHAGFTAAAAAAIGADWRDLAVRFDGHVYLLIAKTLPRLYLDAPPLFPALKDPAFLTGWFPLYPALIRLVESFTGDLRVAALAVSWLASALAVVLFRRLAARFTDRPTPISIVFIFFPTMGLVMGGLAFVEPVFVCAALAAVLAALEDRPWFCAAACAAALLAQKSGLLVALIVGSIRFDARGRAGMRRFAPVLLAALAPAALQLYLWRVFGDPFVNVAVERAHFGGVLFGFPFAAFVRGIFDGPFNGGVASRAAVGLCAAAYLGAECLGWRRGRRAERPLLIWLGVVLAFNFCLGGELAFQSLPRFLSLGAPAALLLAAPLLPRGERWIFFLAPLILVSYLVGMIAVAQNEALTRRAGVDAYFPAFSQALR
jgi:hypothetical protein